MTTKQLRADIKQGAEWGIIVTAAIFLIATVVEGMLREGLL